MELIPGKPHPEYTGKIVSFSKGKLLDRTVVCAANRCGDFMILGARHWDPAMQQHYAALRDTPPSDTFEEGFIDQFGNFMTRKEAWQVVLDNAQILHGPLEFDSYDELYSEHLY